MIYTEEEINYITCDLRKEGIPENTIKEIIENSYLYNSSIQEQYEIYMDKLKEQYHFNIIKSIYQNYKG